MLANKLKEALVTEDEATHFKNTCIALLASTKRTYAWIAHNPLTITIVN